MTDQLTIQNYASIWTSSLDNHLLASVLENEYVVAAIIGVIEGLTEFLPVSSTAHIRFTQGILELSAEDPYWKMFAIVIQLGAILSVLVYFWKRIKEFLASCPLLSKSESQVKNWWPHPLSLVILSFVVTAIPCFLMDKFIGENLESLAIMGWALLIGGIVMWLVDRQFSHRATTKQMEDITIKQAIIIGLAQIAAATFPGASRSMSTIAGGQIMGLSRTAALEFSFFLSIPVMIAATTFKLLQFVVKSPDPIPADRWLVLAVGFVVSFFVAWAVIAWFMDWVKKRGFVPFAIYRMIVGAIVLWIVYSQSNGA